MSALVTKSFPNSFPKLLILDPITFNVENYIVVFYFHYNPLAKNGHVGWWSLIKVENMTACQGVGMPLSALNPNTKPWVKYFTRWSLYGLFTIVFNCSAMGEGIFVMMSIMQQSTQTMVWRLSTKFLSIAFFLGKQKLKVFLDLQPSWVKPFNLTTVRSTCFWTANNPALIDPTKTLYLNTSTDGQGPPYFTVHHTSLPWSKGQQLHVHRFWFGSYSFLFELNVREKSTNNRHIILPPLTPEYEATLKELRQAEQSWIT